MLHNITLCGHSKVAYSQNTVALLNAHMLPCFHTYHTHGINSATHVRCIMTWLGSIDLVTAKYSGK